MRKRVIGQAWDPEASNDGTGEIIISVFLDDPIEVLAVLVHECIHQTVGIDAQHRKPFKDGMRATGLAGKATATVPSDDLRATLKGWAKSLGKYPHARLDGTKGPKPQTGRMLKWECKKCGLIVRSTQRWADTYPGNWPCPCGDSLTQDLPK